MKAIALAALVTLASVSAITPVAAAPVVREPTLTVTGRGSIARAPDRATIPLTIITDAASAERALSDNNAKYHAIIVALEQQHVAAHAIETTSLSMQFNPRPPNPNPQYAQRFGYIVTRSLALSLDDLTVVGRVIDSLTSAAAPEIGSVFYGLRDSESAQHAAQAAAIVDARAQAEAEAAAAGVRITRVLAIGTPSAPIFSPRIMTLAKPAANIPTDIQPGDVHVEASVSVTYALAAASSL